VHFRACGGTGTQPVSISDTRSPDCSRAHPSSASCRCINIGQALCREA